MSSMLINNAEINGVGVTSLLLRNGTIERIGVSQKSSADRTIDAAGNAVLPGLHDHHLHFFALVAARHSVDCSGLSASGLAEVLAQAPGTEWVRGVGYHETDAGELDRHGLTALCGARPVRLQHSSGKMWLLNDLACRLLEVDKESVAGIERGADGLATGRLFRMDGWLAQRMPATAQHVNPVIQELYSYGLTGFTDTSFTNNTNRVDALHQLPFEVYCMGDRTLSRGHLKVMLDEDALPDLNATIQQIRAAHDVKRPVAFHCVSLVELLYLLEAMEQAGSIISGSEMPADRIEHGGVIPASQLDRIRSLGMTVVTQPGFLADRGGRFLDALGPEDGFDLYPYKRLLDAGVPVVASSDAPYGPVNPWRVASAAVNRITDDGRVANAAECVDAEEAMTGYLTSAQLQGGQARQLQAGARANICVLDRPLAQQYADLAPDCIQHTIFNGDLVYSREASIS